MLESAGKLQVSTVKKQTSMVDLGMPTDFSNEKKKCQYELSISAVLEGCHRCHVA